MSGLTGMLFENSPYADEESRRLMQGAQDNSASGLLAIADPGFVPMIQDPSMLNAGMLAFGLGSGPINLGKNVVTKGVKSIRDMFIASTARYKEAGKAVDGVAKEARERLGLDEKEFEELYEKWNWDSTSVPMEDAQAFAKRNAWSSRLTPAKYETLLNDYMSKYDQAKQARGAAWQVELTDDFEKSFNKLPKNRKEEVLKEIRYEAEGTRRAHRQAEDDLKRALESGADPDGPTVAHLKEWVGELAERYQDAVAMAGFAQDYIE